MMRALQVLAIAALLTGCVREVKIDTPFNSAAAAHIHTQGPTTIAGHAFMKRWNGRAAHATGEWVYLIPATPYAEERFAKLYGDKKVMTAIDAARAETTDPRYTEFMRKTKAESDGRFRFEKVAPGDYFIATRVTWKDEKDQFLPEGGLVYERVTVTGKEDKMLRVVVNGE